MFDNIGERDAIAQPQAHEIDGTLYVARDLGRQRLTVSFELSVAIHWTAREPPCNYSPFSDEIAEIGYRAPVPKVKTPAMQDLIIVIAAWLSVNTGLPAADNLPAVETVSPAEMGALHAERVRASSIGGSQGAASPIATGNAELYAFYDDKSRTIYLPAGWNAHAPADVSLLVHEMVHHLQNVGGVAYECPQAREKPAYDAQTLWLKAFGREFASEFSEDPMTVHLRTHCMF
jgi:Domain of unknown function (DUF6647)